MSLKDVFPMIIISSVTDRGARGEPNHW